MPLNPELSQISLNAFRNVMKGEVTFSEHANMNWMYADALPRAIDAAVEAVFIHVLTNAQKITGDDFAFSFLQREVLGP